MKAEDTQERLGRLLTIAMNANGRLGGPPPEEQAEALGITIGLVGSFLVNVARIADALENIASAAHSIDLHSSGS